MATRRVTILRPSLLRPLLHGRTSKAPPPPPPSSQLGFLSPPTPSPARLSSQYPPLLFSSRAFSSSSGSSNIVLLQSGDQVTAALKKAKDDKLPAVFYFTAAWCGPCKVVAPVIEKLSRKFPHVATYKIDIDQEGLESILNNLQIYSVPTFHFFHDGKKATEIVGADGERLKDTMENLYKQE